MTLETGHLMTLNIRFFYENFVLRIKPKENLCYCESFLVYLRKLFNLARFSDYLGRKEFQT